MSCRITEMSDYKVMEHTVMKISDSVSNFKHNDTDSAESLYPHLECKYFELWTVRPDKAEQGGIHIYVDEEGLFRHGPNAFFPWVRGNMIIQQFVDPPPDSDYEWRIGVDITYSPEQIAELIGAKVFQIWINNYRAEHSTNPSNEDTRIFLTELNECKKIFINAVKGDKKAKKVVATTDSASRLLRQLAERRRRAASKANSDDN